MKHETRKEYLGACIYCRTPLYRTTYGIYKAGKSDCLCTTKAICAECGKDCTSELKTRRGRFMWEASGMCEDCQNKVLEDGYEQADILAKEADYEKDTL